MAYYYSLSEFYRSKEWADFRAFLIAERMAADGFVYDEITGKPIVKAYDIILHHKIELTLENVNDVNITLNPDNIQIVSFKTHNEIHNRYLCMALLFRANHPMLRRGQEYTTLLLTRIKYTLVYQTIRYMQRATDYLNAKKRWRGLCLIV